MKCWDGSNISTFTNPETNSESDQSRLPVHLPTRVLSAWVRGVRCPVRFRCRERRDRGAGKAACRSSDGQSLVTPSMKSIATSPFKEGEAMCQAAAERSPNTSRSWEGTASCERNATCADSRRACYRRRRSSPTAATDLR